MKKIISLVVAVAMLASAMVFAIPASASADKSKCDAVNIDYIDALYFETAPTIDGYVTEAEWGEMSFDVEATDCATQDDSDPYNRFLFWRVGDVSDYNSWSYQVWLRWDENYFYIAAKVYDPDIHQLKHGCGNTWDGDALQVRIDPLGPNFASDFHEFSVGDQYTLPWSSQSIPDFLFGYCQIAGGFSESWENTSNKGMTKFSKNPMGEALCVVAPAGSSYSSDTQSGITTYEVAIPWAYVLNGEVDGNKNQITSLEYAKYSTNRRTGNLRGGIDRELGISLVNLEDGNNPDAKYDAWMAWGSGICGDHQTLGSKVATGSNSVMLSETKVTQGDYQKYDPTSLLDATFSTANIDKPGVFYDYLDVGFDASNPKAKQVKYEDLTVLTYDKTPDADRSLWGSDDYQGRVTDIGGDHKNVLDYSWCNNPDGGNQWYIDTREDPIEFLYPLSYTIEFEVRYTGTELVEPNHDSSMHYFFGGADIVSYHCGYVFNDRMFKIVNGSDDKDVIASHPYDLKKDVWYRWRFQFDNDSCNARFWIDDLSTDADDGEGWGELVFNTCWRYFYYAGRTDTLLCYMFVNTQVQFDNVKIYNFGSIGEVETAYEGSESQGTGTAATATTTQTGGGEIAIDTGKVYKKDGSWHVPVFAKSEYATATQLSFTLDYDPAKAEFVGIEGLAEGTYTVTETEKGKVQVVIKDFAAIKALKAGDKYFEFVLKALDDTATASDLSLKLADSYVYTVTTGDTLTYIIIGGVFALGIALCIISLRRRKDEE